jgi:ribosomal protein L37AE/L43A
MKKMYALKHICWKYVLAMKIFLLFVLAALMSTFDSICRNNPGNFNYVYLTITFVMSFMSIYGAVTSPRWMTKREVEIGEMLCPICMKKIASEKAETKILIGECGHIFHSDCIPTSVQEKSCPICRKPDTVWRRLYNLEKSSILFIKSNWILKSFEKEDRPLAPVIL